MYDQINVWRILIWGHHFNGLDIEPLPLILHSELYWLVFLFQCYIHVNPRTCAFVDETVSQNAPPWLHWSWVKEWKKGPKRYAARVRRKRPGMALGDDPIRLNTASRRRQQTNQGHKSTLLQSPPSSSLSRAEISTLEAVYTAPNCIFYPGK